ncbi:biotin--[acetyl-CoA-carboxylase] ligase [Pediococcus stilesii]|uniref:Bifunctional ligase/repressor BirA n=1 Tax=Pediococcus stilesii TaxID=331679 RepID=A0A0R2KWA3_9LACO|nr:biotin--[acetyl-CoA-carboxylase] ligase [Pediococcus stilesii]KRN93794.1 biotin operon repressor [Pediococcus stilesii]
MVVIKTKQKVLLELLKNQMKWISGSEMAADLDVSRETVWKNINALKHDGHVIVSKKNMGYRYENSSNLDETVVNFYKGQVVDHVYVEEQMDSTQVTAKNFLLTNTIEKPIAFLTNHQLKGYGRRGRQFYSPESSGLYLSVVLPRPKFDVNQVGLITTGVALVVAKVLENFLDEPNLKLKWVNDIYLNGRKVAGIITEAITEIEYTSTQALVIGVGINLTTDNFPEELSEKAGAITSKKAINRNQLAAELITTIIKNWDNYLDGSLLPEYRKRSLVIGNRVTLEVGNTAVSGVVEDIDDTGNIVIKDGNGTQRSFNNGEIQKVNI